MIETRAAIVEDARLARQELKALLEAHPQIKVVIEAATVSEAREALTRTPVDVLFLDINLSGESGFDLLESLEEVPAVVFTTAYDEHAVRAFEHQALDYLLKPIRPEALSRAIGRLPDPTESFDTESSESVLERIFIKDGDRCWLVEVDRIRYLESAGNHARVCFEDHKPMVYRSLNRIEARLPVDRFMRISRQFIVNLSCVRSMVPWNQGLLLTMDDGREIEASRRYSQALRQSLSL